MSAKSSYALPRSAPVPKRSKSALDASPQGSKLSGFLVDSFVEKLAVTFTKGELSIGGWSSDRTAPLQVRTQFGAASCLERTEADWSARSLSSVPSRRRPSV